MRRPSGTIVRAAVGIAVSAVALVVVFSSVNVAATADALRNADPRWIVALVAFVVTDIAVRSLRWRVLLSPIGAVPYPTVVGSLLVGYLANNILPARLGELVRAHVLGDRTGISRSTVLGTVVVERVVDTTVVVSIASIAILVLSVRGVVASAVLVGLAVTALLVLVIAAGIFAHRLPGTDRVAALADRRPGVRATLSRLRDGLAVAGRPRTLGAAIGLSLAGWSCTVLSFAAAAQAVGFQPSIAQAALLAAGTNLATAVPSAPGYVGTFELAAVTIAASIGMPANTALAMALLVHATGVLLTSAGGAIVLVRHGGISIPTGRSAERA